MGEQSSKSFTTTDKPLTATQSLISGSVSGLIVRVVIAPIDIVKIRLQLSTSTSGVISTVKSIIKNEGLYAFWKGNIPAELMYIIYGGSQFFCYNSLGKIYDSTLSGTTLAKQATVKNSIVGFSAGMVSTVVSYPFDLLRTRLASNSNGFRSLNKEIKDIWVNYGFKGFFGGVGVSMLYIGSMTGISFGVYGTIMSLGEQQASKSSYLNTATVSSIAAPLAGLICKTAVYPLDLIKRNLQIHRDPVLQVATRILKERGIGGFYRGLTPALVKSVPATAVSLWCFETTSKILRSWDDDSPLE
ncbi:thiamine transporter [Martiniozyma asiatica (nom. inval.)]|nr:thiamine transporter [Martiniozyma asiatica]